MRFLLQLLGLELARLELLCLLPLLLCGLSLDLDLRLACLGLTHVAQSRSLPRLLLLMMVVVMVTMMVVEGRPQRRV